MVQYDQLQVDAYLPQRYLGQLGEATTVTISKGKQHAANESIPATIDRQVNVVNDNDRTFLLRLAPQQSHQLVPGASVTANINIRSAEHQLTVPQDAVIRYSDGRTSVWVVIQQQGQPIVRERLVELGQRFNGWVVIDDAVAAGDAVVVRGNEALVDGETVQTSLSNDYD